MDFTQILILMQVCRLRNLSFVIIAPKLHKAISCQQWNLVPFLNYWRGYLYHPGTLLDRCLKLYTTLWNIWTYQQLCKQITQLVYNFTQVVYNFTQVVYFFYTTVGRFICFTVLCKLFKQWSNSVSWAWFNHGVFTEKRQERALQVSHRQPFMPKSFDNHGWPWFGKAFLNHGQP